MSLEIELTVNLKLAMRDGWYQTFSVCSYMALRKWLIARSMSDVPRSREPKKNPHPGRSDKPRCALERLIFCSHCAGFAAMAADALCQLPATGGGGAVGRGSDQLQGLVIHLRSGGLTHQGTLST